MFFPYFVKLAIDRYNPVLLCFVCYRLELQYCVHIRDHSFTVLSELFYEGRLKPTVLNCTFILSAYFNVICAI